MDVWDIPCSSWSDLEGFLMDVRPKHAKGATEPPLHEQHGIQVVFRFESFGLFLLLLAGMPTNCDNRTTNSFGCGSRQILVRCAVDLSCRHRLNAKGIPVPF